MRLAGLRGWFGRGRPGADPGDASAAPAMQPAPAAPDAPARAVEPPPPWSAARLELTDGLWGEGFVAPGGPEEVQRLLRPLGLTAASSLLLLGAAAGGPAVAATSLSGAWVSGFEADPALVAEAGARAARLGRAIAERAVVARWEPAAPRLRRQGFHHALLLDVLAPATMAPALAAVAQALKPQGQLVVAQSVAGPGFDPAGAVERRWLALARLPEPPPAQASVDAALRGLGFEIWVAEDTTAHQAGLAVAGWASMLPALEGLRGSSRRAAGVVAEAELWFCRLRLMQSGRLRTARWHARGPAA